MKKLIYIFVLSLFVFTSCEKNEVNCNQNPSSTISSQTENVNRSIRPVVLGKKLRNPFSVENMQAALDTLKAHSDQLAECMKAPGSINDIEITTTDLYVRFLPKDSAQYRKLMNDSTLTLFDFPLDYEIKQNGDYYIDPNVNGNYTWLYTRVPVGYVPPIGITYEILANLFIMENSSYYSEEKINPDGVMKAKTDVKSDMNDALKTIKAISFFNTGNKYGEKKVVNSNFTGGAMKVTRSVKKKFLWTTWYETEYYPSGTICVQDYHQMNSAGYVTDYPKIRSVPLKGAKIHLWNWFKWNSIYTNENGYYESNMSYDGDPEHYIYFSGKNRNNSWDLDRVMLWGVCLWVQKYSLGEQSKDNYDTTINSTSDAWSACLTNNAFYEFMTIADNEGLMRPPSHLQVALRVNLSGESSAPLFQNHTNTLSTAVLAGFFASVFLTGGATAPYLVAYIAFLNSLPDVLLSAGNLENHQTDYGQTQKNAINAYFSTIWHEMSHTSNLQSVVIEKGYWTASDFWSNMIGTEVWHSLTSGHPYGNIGDENWQQVALCEGWATYREYCMKYRYLEGRQFSGFSSKFFPYTHINLFYDLENIGCSIPDLEKCLSERTVPGFRDRLIIIYPDLRDSIIQKVKGYE